MKIQTILTAFVLTILMSCSSSGGKVTLQFSNLTTANSQLSADGRTERAATLSAPTVFEMKLIAVYLTQDIDPVTQNNIGGTSMVYLNPDCGENIGDCDISTGTNDQGQPFGHIVTSYFDFAQNSDAVNQALNAQARTVSAATYRYVRMEFCKYNSASASNIKYQGGTMAAPVEFQRNSCTVNSAAFATPLEIAEGNTVTVTLSYDIHETIQSGSDAMGDACSPDNSDPARTCFTLPTFTPSASKQ